MPSYEQSAKNDPELVRVDGARIDPVVGGELQHDPSPRVFGCKRPTRMSTR
jgi:hypothetical protein